MRRVDREGVVLRPAADDHARDQPAAADHVDHGELLGDAGRRVVERQGVADDGDLHPRGLAGEDRRDQVRRRHLAVGVLVVLVDADAVEAELLGVDAARRGSGCRARGRRAGSYSVVRDRSPTPAPRRPGPSRCTASDGMRSSAWPNDTGLDPTVKLGSRRRGAALDRYDALPPVPPAPEGTAGPVLHAGPWIWVTLGAVVVPGRIAGVGSRSPATDSSSAASAHRRADAEVHDDHEHVDDDHHDGAAATTTTRHARAAGPRRSPRSPGGTWVPGRAATIVQAYQQRLVDLHFDPGAVDGKYGGGMTYAVQALQKIMGVERTGRIGRRPRS